jgi:GAF domain-containing protein
MAGVTSAEASTVDETPELVARLERVMVKLRADFSGADAKVSTTRPIDAVERRGDAEVLRRHAQAYLELMNQRLAGFRDLDKTARRVDEAAAHALAVERVSVWFLDDGRTKIRCVDLFERGSGKHSCGVELSRRDFPAYFDALGKERTIAAHDAHTDPRTSCFSESYLRPLGIASMLDVPIWANGKMIGVVCHEHVGGKRIWNTDEERFAYLMSSVLALATEIAAVR